MIYFDNAATSFPKPEEVYEAAENCMRRVGANPGRSGHRAALAAGRLLYQAREGLADLFGIDDPSRIAFAANATAALNLAIKGSLQAGDHIVISSMEHNSVIRPIKALESQGITYTVVACDAWGQLTVRDVERALKPQTRMVAMTHASNVTGTLLPIAAIGALCRSRDLLFLVDASQTAGVFPLDPTAMGIDLLAFAGHKSLFGLQGTGGLYIAPGAEPRPLMEGGTGSRSDEITQPLLLPDRYESGTQNTPGLAGLAAGLAFIHQRGLQEIREHEQALVDRLEGGLVQIAGATIYGPPGGSCRAPVLSLNLEGRDASEVAYLLDHRFHIAVRPGLHCSPLAHKTLGTLEQGTIRFSPGYFNTEAEVDQALLALDRIAKGLK